MVLLYAMLFLFELDFITYPLTIHVEIKTDADSMARSTVIRSDLWTVLPRICHRTVLSIG